jgi:hypothetical protein
MHGSYVYGVESISRGGGGLGSGRIIRRNILSRNDLGAGRACRRRGGGGGGRRGGGGGSRGRRSRRRTRRCIGRSRRGVGRGRVWGRWGCSAIPIKLPTHIEDTGRSGLEEGEKTFAHVEITVTATTRGALSKTTS